MSLFSTTVRFAGTNEVASISNASIATLRVVNGNRSPNAIIVLQLPYKLALIDEKKLPALRKFVDTYIKGQPSDWRSLVYCRVAEIDYPAERVDIVFGIQSRYAWQDLGRIAKAKALLKTEIYIFGRDRKINYDELPRRELVYDAGRLRRGGTIKDRSLLHDPSNIISHESEEIVTNTRSISNEERETILEEPSGSANALFLSNLRSSQEG